ncbi:MAG TPA: zinc metalloprotease HtpX [Candidatus Saccharimonadales bacterium]|jgi:heat shock protein HtpX|nr:zinc metalloprotease HtpX [Candidatus Saccharimonadales bacterium]
MYSAIAANKRRTWLILFLFVVLIAALGYVAGLVYGHSYTFTALALVIAGVYALIQYFAAAKIALAINGAQEIEKKDSPAYYRVVENLSIAAGLPMPKVYLMDDPAPNAFATGRDPNHSAVCATTGLLDIMNDTELEAVLAHEISHVRNYDIRVMVIVFGLVSAIGLIADLIMNFFWFGGRNDREQQNPIFLIIGIAAALLAPLIAFLIQMAVSRRREYLADSSGALLTRYPEGLASALEKIRDNGSTLKRPNTSTAHLFFANPLSKKSFANLFSTHPPIEDRIARLRNMGTKL